ncbi:SH3 domain-containing protein [Pedomonas mirosovicensis]|uniref:SH3 domain-containing protein n=1 Tax=Pedomonas mirosovicensis TaxID=2908641 RepID=UPI0021694C46|nr:SH3 domain-containing protein [Pedomonas mirosovicensis]MCH8683989.1 hypothetical protein [Pedomonas mirosovicensis]
MFKRPNPSLLPAGLLGLTVAFGLAVQAAPAAAQGTAGDEDGAKASETGLPLPRFVSLGASEVNLRTGPDRRYPIAWVYKRRGLPVEIIQEYGVWRRIRDVEGVEGWVNRHLLSNERTAYVTAQVRTLYARPESGSAAVWRVEPGVVAKIVLCEEDWCQLNIGGRTGWIRRNEIWGVYPRETID